MAANYASKYQDAKGLLIHTQTPEQQAIGHEIISTVNDRWNPSPYFYHLKPGGHVAAVKSHLNDKFFTRADLRKFFNHVTRKKLTRSLGGIGIAYESVLYIVENSTVLDEEASKRHVPFGFVQSPLLATLALHKSALGRFLKKVAKSGTITLSVYMDDILLSSNSKDELHDAIKELQQACSSANFSINSEKLIMPCEELEIFNIELSHSKMRLTERRLEEFARAIQENASEEVVGGIISYAHTVNIQQRDYLLSLLN